MAPEELGIGQTSILYGDPLGALWIGGDGGLVEIGDDGIRRVGVADGLPSGDVRAVRRTSNGASQILSRFTLQ